MQPHPIVDSSSFESLLVGAIKAGFPSPAEDVREKLDLVKLLVRHSASTFFFQIDGVSMVDADMDEGDIIMTGSTRSNGWRLQGREPSCCLVMNTMISSNPSRSVPTMTF